MKHINRFESFQSNTVTQNLVRQADTYSKIDRLDNSKMIAKNHTGILYFLANKNQYYLQIPNTENKSYIVKGVPPTPDLFIKLEPTEDFTQEDLDNYSTLSKIIAYDKDYGNQEDYRYKVFGYVLSSDLKKSGIEDVLHVTGIEKN